MRRDANALLRDKPDGFELGLTRIPATGIIHVSPPAPADFEVLLSLHAAGGRPILGDEIGFLGKESLNPTSSEAGRRSLRKGRIFVERNRT